MSGPAIERAAVAEAVGVGLGQRVLSGAAELLPVPVPGVGDTFVWLVRDELLDHPLQAYVGRWPDGSVRVLSDNQPGWMELIDAAGARISDPEMALAYVRQFLEVTRGPSVIVREVASLDDLRWRPGSPDEEERRAAFVAGNGIEPPVARRTNSGFHVELTLVVDQRVQRNMFEVTADGAIAASYRVLAEDLPLPIVR